MEITTINSAGHQILDVILQPVYLFLLPQFRTYWGYLLISFAIALILYCFQQIRQKSPAPIEGIFSYCFPKSIYGHRSAIKDYQFVLIEAVLSAAIFAPLLLIFAPSISDGVQRLFHTSFLAGCLGPSTLWSNIALTVVEILAFDLMIFIQHYLFHKVPALWAFHKVHHSAEVLTPVTVYRMHPIDEVTAALMSTTAIGIIDGLFQTLFSTPAGAMHVFGLNIVLFAYYFFGYNLRHSHIPFYYGPALSHVLVSPVLHQMHHSAEERHLDKNFGFIFSFWDRLAGTLYLPNGPETFRLGLTDQNETEGFQSLKTMYFKPFQEMWKSRNGIWWVLGLLSPLAALFFIWLGQSLPDPTAVSSVQHDSVYLEELTWTQVQQKMHLGFTSVLIPTGGTEQNGPHLPLGKHNIIVRYTGGEIARQVGHTLVAPVMAYVPEGNINPPTDHMRYPGTLSLSESTFEAVLEETTRSLKQHGFKHIYFLGDSGGNQQSQEHIAQKLSVLWKKEGVQVISLGHYYYQNGQTMWLSYQGHTLDEIGSHAGIRDTSEILQLAPQLVSQKALKTYNQTQLESQGVIGDPKQASAEIGQKMLELKIRAAVLQIKNSHNF